MHEIVERRLAERRRLIDAARGYARDLSGRIDLERVLVAGSVARGDFNVWSDIDVVVVAAKLPARANDRAALLLEDAPAWLQPVGFTPAEHASELERGNPLLIEAANVGIPVWGEEAGAAADADADG